MSRIPLDLLGQSGIAYFGRTTASVSHELKNALAIIKENAGLIEDYLLMAEKGMPIAPEKFKMITGRIGVQTQRADKLIKDMNRFAHSSDNHCTSTDLNELAGLFVALSHREAAMRQVELALSSSKSPAMVTTSPFLLLTLMGRCFTFCLGAATPKSRLLIESKQSENSKEICIGPFSNVSALTGDTFPGEQETELLNTLKASFMIDESCGTVIIGLA